MGKEYKNPDLLRELYHEEHYTISEIADELDTNYGRIYNEMDKHGIERRSSKESRDIRNSHAGCRIHGKHDDEDWLREKYYDEHLSISEIAELAGVNEVTIMRRMDEHGIDRRPSYVTRVLKNPGAGFVHADDRGYEMIKHSVDDHTYNYPIHRLLAIAKYGYDAVRDSVVHHKNGVKWDNRPENIMLLDSQSDHAKYHHEFRDRDSLGRYT